MGRVKRLTEDSFDGTAHIKLCGTSCPYDKEYCASDECRVLNEVAEKLARYERLEEQIAESAEQYIQKGIAMPYAVMPEVTRGVVKTVFEGFGGGKEE
jgi:hypothetical protein